MNIYRQPWRLIQNRIRGEGGREIDKFRGIYPPTDGATGSEAWIGSVTKALGATDQKPLGYSEVILPDGRKEYLYQVIKENPREILGEQHIKKNGKTLGILVKYLDAKENFALEAHPTRQVAKDLWNSNYGKEECWYILGTREDVDEPPFVYLGFKEGVTKELFARYYDANNMKAIENLCHKIPVHAGDVYMIGGGLPHALGAGCFALELQEPSDIGVTPLPQKELAAYYTSCGCKMEWEDEEAYRNKILNTFIFEGKKELENKKKWKIPEKIIRLGDWGKEVYLIGPEQTSYFSCTRLDLNGCINVRSTGYPQIAVITDGRGKMLYEDGCMEVKKGDELFLPYDVKHIRVTGKLNIIFCHPEGA